MADMAQAHDSLVKKKDQEHADDLAQHQQQTQEHIKGEKRRAPRTHSPVDCPPIKGLVYMWLLS